MSIIPTVGRRAWRQGVCGCLARTTEMPPRRCERHKHRLYVVGLSVVVPRGWIREARYPACVLHDGVWSSSLIIPLIWYLETILILLLVFIPRTMKKAFGWFGSLTHTLWYFVCMRRRRQTTSTIQQCIHFVSWWYSYSSEYIFLILHLTAAFFTRVATWDLPLWRPSYTFVLESIYEVYMILRSTSLQEE